jgi:S-adenosylmethionine-diacylglycerol 3-amino-3-carboxypropyl transferase
MRDAEVVYAQNWEDPELELAALAIASDDEVVAICGGGCTALSLLAREPRRLHVVDRNPAQLHLLQLKLAAVQHLASPDAVAFLGGAASDHRHELFEKLAPALPSETARFWRLRRRAIGRGVISQGRIERYFALLRCLLRAVHPPARTEWLFAQPTLDAQARFYAEQWNTRGWRRAFLLGHKRILDRVLDPSFYRHVVARDLPAELHGRAERCLTELPIARNYFLSWILRGRYPESTAGHPPYLQPAATDALRRNADRVETLVETHVADVASFLATRPSSSCDKFYLSNVTEWLREDEVLPLFEEVLRVARDGAVVCYRALMIDRVLPASIASRLEEDVAVSESLARRDRAFVNAAFHVVRVCKTGGAHARG